MAASLSRAACRHLVFPRVHARFSGLPCTYRTVSVLAVALAAASSSYRTVSCAAGSAKVSQAMAASTVSCSTDWDSEELALNFRHDRGYSYDYSQPTWVNHRSNCPTCFYGPFASIRSRMDRTYHFNYHQARQEVQDAIITEVIHRGKSNERPWVVYTAGPMGVGKSRALRRLSASGVLPMDDFVCIDPDEVKTMLPERELYLRRNKGNASTLLHKESSFICELIERLGLDLSRNLIVDGSLRDVAWYSTWFGWIRAVHPQYRIAILHVTAEPERIEERLEARAAKTDRHVPADVAAASRRAAPVSVAKLAPLADLVAVLDNNGDGEDWPKVLPPATVHQLRAALCGRGADITDEVNARFEFEPGLDARCIRRATIDKYNAGAPRSSEDGPGDAGPAPGPPNQCARCKAKQRL